MVEFLKSWVLNIVTLAIFIVILEILIPSGKIKKIINLISGFIILIALINPFISLFNKGVDIKEFQFQSSNQMDKTDISKNGKILQEAQMKQIAEVYRKKVIDEIDQSIKEIDEVQDVNADVIMNDDYKSDKFGELKRVYLKLKLKNGGGEVKQAVRIEKIEVNGRNKVSQDGKGIQNDEVSNELRKKIGDKLLGLFNLSEKDLVISLQKE